MLRYLEPVVKPYQCLTDNPTRLKDMVEDQWYILDEKGGSGQGILDLVRNSCGCGFFKLPTFFLRR